MQNEPPEKQFQGASDGKGAEGNETHSEYLARLYRFYSQQNNDLIVYKIPLENIQIKTFYEKYGRYFEKLGKVLVKYGIDEVKFIEFCTLEMHITDPRELVNINSFIKFAEYGKIQQQYENICRYFMKSVNNIADYCIENGITPKEYIKLLITENKMAYEYTTGRISKYYLGSFSNFKEIYLKLDSLNRDELSIIYNVSESLNQEVQEAFLKKYRKNVHPILTVEEIIKQKNRQKTNKN